MLIFFLFLHVLSVAYSEIGLCSNKLYERNSNKIVLTFRSPAGLHPTNIPASIGRSWKKLATAIKFLCRFALHKSLT